MAAGLHGDARPPSPNAVLTAALKLGDIAARSLFVLLALFALPAREAGQLGLLLTLAGFFSFFVGFERYLDLQRTLARLATPQGADVLLSTLRLHATHCVVAIPVLTAALLWWVQLPAELVVAGLGEAQRIDAYRSTI